MNGQGWQIFTHEEWSAEIRFAARGGTSRPLSSEGVPGHVHEHAR